MKTIPGGVFRCDEMLVAAIDALDAPQPRYTAYEAFNQKMGDCFIVADSKSTDSQNVAYCTKQSHAKKIAAALNAADAREGKA